MGNTKRARRLGIRQGLSAPIASADILPHCPPHTNTLLAAHSFSGEKEKPRHPELAKDLPNQFQNSPNTAPASQLETALSQKRQARKDKRALSQQLKCSKIALLPAIERSLPQNLRVYWD